jgi:Carboxypeptidase regulatory-like domain/TonB dependent receptor-like, beta-barrel
MRVKTFVLGLAALLLCGLPIFAQGNPTGKLSGRVMSDSQPVPGVLVTATSPNLQGSKTTTTSSNGDYLFPSLPAGEYTVTFELEGMQSVRKELRVAAAQAATLDAEMSLTRIEEEIVVTGTLEEISRGVQSATTYTKTLVDELPAGRTINQIVALSPGIQPNGPTKDSSTGLGNITISGAPTYENLFLLNGVVLNENIRGQAFDLYIEDAVQETTTATAGVSAEYGRFSGGVVNVLTKSGGNDFSGSFRTTFNNQSWEEKRLDPNTGQDAPQTDKVVPTYELTLGGPVLRDRLWFFVAGRDRNQEETRQTSAPTPDSYTNVRDQQRYEGKLTATLTPRHTLLGSYSEIEDLEEGNSFGIILDNASLVTRTTPQKLWSANYTGTFTDNLLLTAQYSKREFTFIDSGADSTDLIAGTLLLDRSRGNARYHSPTFCGVCKPEERDNTNALAKASYFLSSERLGSHDLVGGYDTFDDIRAADNHQSGSDWRILGTSATISGDTITPIFLGNGSTIIQFDPILQSTQGTSFKTNSIFANDTWRLSGRLSLSLGLRYDKNDGENAASQKVADDSALSPRLAATFDAKGNGNLLLHGSYGQYVTALANSIGDSTSPGGVPSTFQWIYRGPDITGLSQEDALRALFNWFATANGGLPTVASPVGGGLVPVSAAAIRGVNSRINGSLDSPNVTEYALGVTARIGSRGLVRADAVYREWGNFYHQRTDTSTGQVPAQIGSVVQRFDLTLVENNDTLYNRTYKGLHTQFRFRATDKLDLGGNWTLSKTEGNYNAENQGSGPLPGGLGNYPEYFDVRWTAPDGPLSIDQRHRVNLYGVFKIFDDDRHSLSASLLQSYFSGHPYEAVGTIVIRPFVTNPGYLTPPARSTYFFSERGAFKTPDVFRTDVSLNYDFRVGKINLFVKPEVVNVFNGDKIDTTDIRYFNTTVLTADTTAGLAPFNPFTDTPVEGVNWVRGEKFGKAINPLAFQQPRTYRIGVGLRF